MLVRWRSKKTNLEGCFKRLSVCGNRQSVDGRLLWLHLARTRNRSAIPSRSMVLADLHKAPENKLVFHPLKAQCWEELTSSNQKPVPLPRSPHPLYLPSHPQTYRGSPFASSAQDYCSAVRRRRVHGGD